MLSFVIPAHNEEGYVGDCLRSIKDELARSPHDAEIIVVNNASTDNTKNVALTFPGVTVVDEMQKGLVFARAAGYRAAHGDLIANVDADTRLTRGWIDKVLMEFAKDNKLVALSGPFIYFDLPVTTRAMVKVFYAIGLVTQLINQHVLHVGAMLQGGNFILRRDALERIGGYDTTIAFYGEDTDIARRMSKVGKVKWTFTLPMYTSGRRLKGEGVVTMGAKYALNFIWTTVFKKPYTKEYIDIREGGPAQGAPQTKSNT